MTGIEPEQLDVGRGPCACLLRQALKKVKWLSSKDSELDLLLSGTLHSALKKWECAVRLYAAGMTALVALWG
eukprot:1157285-Pelagomonas_calceolata.AAC.3